MRIDVITAFPSMLEAPLNESILKQARTRIGLQIYLHDLRNFATDKHQSIDDTPYGGGAGMVMMADPIFRAIEHIQKLTQPSLRIVFPTPQGNVYSQEQADEFSKLDHLVFICGHYKAVDQRVIDSWVTDEVSVGDFVVSGGEFPTMLIIDSIVRLVPGAINDIESANSDSFQDGLLDAPYYTRPEEYRGMKVPEVLMSGHHKKIADWRGAQRLERTRERRPDLLKKYKNSNQNA